MYVCVCIYIYIYTHTHWRCRRNISYILNCYLHDTSKLRQVTMVVFAFFFFFFFFTDMKKARTDAHHVFVCWNISYGCWICNCYTVNWITEKKMYICYTELFMLLSFYVGMMMFRIEKGYCYELETCMVCISPNWSHLKKMVTHWLAGAAITTCLSSLAPYRWQFKM